MNVDNTQEYTCLSLCSGYGGLELGIRRACPNIRTVAYVEVEAFACANLVAKMEAGLLDAAPIWTDIKTFNAEPFQDRIYIVTAGYPCQPFSVAGKRQGTDDPRHLWPYIERLIQTVRPVWCFFENVAGHLTIGFPSVYRSLRLMGYKVEAGLFTAAECGLPISRERLFILASSNSNGCKFECSKEQGKATASRDILPRRRRKREIERLGSCFFPEESLQKKSETRICRKVDGIESGVDRLRLLGNGVVPQQAEKAFRYLMRLFNDPTSE